jgi:hypothetical protein
VCGGGSMAGAKEEGKKNFARAKKRLRLAEAVVVVAHNIFPCFFIIFSVSFPLIPPIVKVTMWSKVRAETKRCNLSPSRSR